MMIPGSTPARPDPRGPITHRERRLLDILAQIVRLAREDLWHSNQTRQKIMVLAETECRNAPGDAVGERDRDDDAVRS
jgi:hypothetical protein